jgi:hypothetical protein
MAELLFTENDFNDYISSLDVNNTTNFKVLSSLQLLRPSLFRETIFLLINGRININDLALFNINNFTIQTIVDNVLSLPATITERNIFYKEYLKGLPLFNTFLNMLNANFSTYLAHKNISSTTFAKEITIDPLKIAAGSYSNLREAQVVYNTLKTTYYDNISNLSISAGVTTFNYSETLDSSDNKHYLLSYVPNTGSLEVYKNGNLVLLNTNYSMITTTNIEFILTNLSTDIITVVYSTNSNTLPNLALIKNLVSNEINLYKLIYTTSNINPLNLNSTTTAIGWLTRELFQFLKYSNLGDNINWIAREMATEYDLDVPKNGIYTMKRLLQDYTWERLDTPTTLPEFIELFSKIYFLRITLVTVYGNIFFSREIIDKELSIVNDNIIPFLDSIRLELVAFIADLMSNI